MQYLHEYLSSGCNSGELWSLRRAVDRAGHGISSRRTANLSLFTLVWVRTGSDQAQCRAVCVARVSERVRVHFSWWHGQESWEICSWLAGCLQGRRLYCCWDAVTNMIPGQQVVSVNPIS